MKRTALSALLAVVVLAACGGGTLTSDEKLAVGDAQLTLSGAVLTALDSRVECMRELDYWHCYGNPREAVEDLVAIYRAKPDAKYDDLTMRQVLQDEASKLDDYEPNLAAELDRALN